MNPTNPFDERKCPVCGKKLRLMRLVCPGCRAEYPVDAPLPPYSHLSPEQQAFLTTFLSCRGNLKEVQAEMSITYFQARQQLDQLLITLGLGEKLEKQEDKDMKLTQLFSRKFAAPAQGSPAAGAGQEGAAAQAVHTKLAQAGGRAVVLSIQKKPYEIRITPDGRGFVCDQLPMVTSFRVFDAIADLLDRKGGTAPKGNGRIFRLGDGQCTADTVVGTVAIFSGAKPGETVYDPVFVLSAVMEWAGVAQNCRGYLRLDPQFRTAR